PSAFGIEFRHGRTALDRAAGQIGRPAAEDARQGWPPDTLCRQSPRLRGIQDSQIIPRLEYLRGRAGSAAAILNPKTTSRLCEGRHRMDVRVAFLLRTAFV